MSILQYVFYNVRIYFMGITETFCNIANMPIRQKNANQVSVELTNYMGVVLDTLTFM